MKSKQEIASLVNPKNINGRTVLAIILIVGVIQLASMFHSVEYKGKNIRVFEVIVTREDWVNGTVLFNYKLETEYGEIQLKPGCKILGVEHSLYSISIDSFKQKKAFHNLVVEGIKMPENIRVSFFASKYGRSGKYRHQIGRLGLDNQEIIISGVPLGIDDLMTKETDNHGDISMAVNYAPEIITLADSTQIMIDPSTPFYGRLFLYLEDGQWVLTNLHSPIPVKLHGESEFKQYGSITFRKDWGEFIEGEEWQEKPPRENIRIRRISPYGFTYPFPEN